MNDRLDQELRALQVEPPAGYDQVETEVWRRIDRHREAKAAAPRLLALQAAAIIGSLAVGVAGGGATAVVIAGHPNEVSVFSVNAELAPSTLLDHHE